MITNTNLKLAGIIGDGEDIEEELPEEPQFESELTIEPIPQEEELTNESYS